MATFTGTSASETLTGGSGDDLLEGLGGNDRLLGGDGDDVYLFRGAFGRDSVRDPSGVNEIRFGNGYTEADIRIQRTGFNNDLTFHQIGGEQSVTLDNYFFQDQTRAARVVFEATGTVWTLSDGSAFRTVGFRGTSAAETLTGSSGDDLLIGLGGNDRLDAGDGNDVYLFSGAFGRDVVTDTSGVDTLVIAADYAEWDFRLSRSSFGSDLLLTGADGSNEIVLDNYYSSGNGIDRALFLRTGTVLSLTGGQPAFQPGFFDRDGYLSANPDIRAAGIDPYAHYVTAGWREGRDPSARFDTDAYLRHNPDVAAAGINPLVHYLSAGQGEGRAAHPAVGRGVVDGFDSEYYLLANSDVGLAGLDARTHFETSGWREGRDPSAFFDTSFYLERYADVRNAGMNPLDHYRMSGWREGRDPSASFSTNGYLGSNPDVATAGLNPLQHYLGFGAAENRSLGIVAAG